MMTPRLWMMSWDHGDMWHEEEPCPGGPHIARCRRSSWEASSSSAALGLEAYVMKIRPNLQRYRGINSHREPAFALQGRQEARSTGAIN